MQATYCSYCSVLYCSVLYCSVQIELVLHRLHCSVRHGPAQVPWQLRTNFTFTFNFTYNGDINASLAETVKFPFLVGSLQQHNVGCASL